VPDIVSLDSYFDLLELEVGLKLEELLFSCDLDVADLQLWAQRFRILESIEP